MEHDADTTEAVHRFSYRTTVVVRFVLAMIAISAIMLATGLVSITVAVTTVIGGTIGVSSNRSVEIAPTGIRAGRRPWQPWDDVSFTRKRNGDILKLGSGWRAPKVPLRNFAASWRTDDIGIALGNTIPPGALRTDMGLDPIEPAPPPPGYVHFDESARHS